MLLFYSRKLAFYNLSIYESNSKAGYCYLWSEVDGCRGSNEIISILFLYLNSVDESKVVNDIALYCDSCPGQNKNHKVLSMLHYFLSKCSKNIKTITINYLLPGHTYMPVDSIHACIDKNVKKKVIWAPSEWSTVIRNSRINNGPYNTIVLKHTDFMDWKQVCDSVFSKPKMTDTNNCEVKFKKIRSVCFTQDEPDEIKIAYSFFLQEDGTINYSTIDLKANTKLRSSVLRSPSVEPLYSNRLPLSNVKYKDLQKLCLKRIIPECYHHEYLNLPHKVGVRDELPETDDDE